MVLFLSLHFLGLWMSVEMFKVGGEDQCVKYQNSEGTYVQLENMFEKNLVWQTVRKLDPKFDLVMMVKMELCL